MQIMSVNKQFSGTKKIVPIIKYIIIHDAMMQKQKKTEKKKKEENMNEDVEMLDLPRDSLT